MQFSNKEHLRLSNFRWFLVDFRELRMRKLPHLVQNLLKNGRPLVVNKKRLL
jgi:hypothetical protein